jgi:hypothetical protein
MRHLRLTSIIVAGLAVGLLAAHATLGSPARTAVGSQVAVTIRGSGSRVVAIRLARSSPLVATASYRGESNFIVHLVGPTTVYLFNEIGTYSGQLADTDVKAGTYRVAVEAEGSWSIAFAQPTPPRNAKVLPGTVSGHGDRVIAVRTLRNLHPIVTGTHTGQANFIVDLIGYGRMTGRANLFNEIGRYHGQTLMDSLPRGTYLLAVQADGSWTIRLAP